MSKREIANYLLDKNGLIIQLVQTVKCGSDQPKATRRNHEGLMTQLRKGVTKLFVEAFDIEAFNINIMSFFNLFKIQGKLFKTKKAWLKMQHFLTMTSVWSLNESESR